MKKIKIPGRLLTKEEQKRIYGAMSESGKVCGHCSGGDNLPFTATCEDLGVLGCMGPSACNTKCTTSPGHSQQ